MSWYVLRFNAKIGCCRLGCASGLLSREFIDHILLWLGFTRFAFGLLAFTQANGCSLERIDLLCGQGTIVSLGKIRQLDRANRYTLQCQYLMTKASQYATNFAILAFAQNDLNLSRILVRLLDLGVICFGLTFSKINALFE
jgi:hypothetical protein